MQYTSIENIHKVIDPLFPDDLKNELADIGGIPIKNTWSRRLHPYRDKLTSLAFLEYVL